MTINVNYSTFDIAKLTALPKLGTLPQGWHLQHEAGNGCFLDPPGYPSYYLRSVYTSAGDEPTHGPVMVISYQGEDYVVRHAEDDYEALKGLLKSLYKPLPIDHVRVRTWMLSLYSHNRSCYWDEKGEVEPFQYGKPTFFIYPVPEYKRRHFQDDPRFSEEWRAQEKVAVATANRDLEAKIAKLATMDNHMAVRAIRRVYPEYDPTPDTKLVLAADSIRYPGDWWERYAERPSVTECKPPSWLGGRHVNEGWCQFCGRTDNK